MRGRNCRLELESLIHEFIYLRDKVVQLFNFSGGRFESEGFQVDGPSSDLRGGFYNALKHVTQAQFLTLGATGL